MTTTPKPTATELIERIDSINKTAPDWDVSIELGELLTDLRANLSDPWISVDERLPEYGRRMAIDFDDAVTGQFYTGWLCDDDVWYCEQLGVVIVTHWSPLPPLPQKAGEA